MFPSTEVVKIIQIDSIHFQVMWQLTESLCCLDPDTFVRYITSLYGWLRLLTIGQLTDPSLNTLFIKTTTIFETMEAIL